MAIKDFSILLEKVENNQSKKDVALVTGYNSIVQAIEQVMKTQKGELISDSNIGSEYFSFIFQSLDRGSLEYNLASYIDAAIPQINDVKVILTNQTEETLSFQIQFSILDGIKVQKNASCFIEVDIS